MEPEQQVTCECRFECTNVDGDVALYEARIIIPHFPLYQSQRKMLAIVLMQHSDVLSWGVPEDARLIRITSITKKVIEENVTPEELRRMYLLLTIVEHIERVPLP